MKVVLPGGSGLLGTILARALVHRGHEVVVLSRHPRPAPWLVVAWDAATLGPWAGALDGADAVINLAGRSVNCRYNATNRQEILESRVLSTRVVGDAIARAVRPPRLWLQASTATIYAHRYDAPNDERSGILGGHEPGAPSAWNFSIDVARAWEEALAETRTDATRKVALRTAMVMSAADGSVFEVLYRLARVGLGGSAGDGKQFVSWIHHADFVRALRAAAGVPIGLPATPWMLEIGAFVMRTETELVLKSRRVVPAKLLESGFTFDFPSWPETARVLCIEQGRPQGRAA